jgi:hypothetical protein
MPISTLFERDVCDPYDAAVRYADRIHREYSRDDVCVAHPSPGCWEARWLSGSGDAIVSVRFFKRGESDV